VILKKQWHDEPWKRRGTVHQRQAAFTTASVTSYARPFVQSKGWPRFPSNLMNYDAASEHCTTSSSN
jgi:hypothetical protein